MDSSPDLSLKLRRGSSDSRDSFYMDFAQGIDSDIEEVETIAAGGPQARAKLLQQQQQQHQQQQQQLDGEQQPQQHQQQLQHLHHHHQLHSTRTPSPPPDAQTPPIDVPPPMALLPAHISSTTTAAVSSTTTATAAAAVAAAVVAAATGAAMPPPQLPPGGAAAMATTAAMAAMAANCSGGRITPPDVLRMAVLENGSLPDPSNLTTSICSSSSRHPPSPSSPDKILISPETLSHHSSPARSAKLKCRSHHVTIMDETTTINGAGASGAHAPLCAETPCRASLTLSASQHQLLAAASTLSAASPSPSATAPATGSSSLISPGASSSAGPLALLYHGSASGTTTTTHLEHQHHHHHHLHPILPVVRRPNSRQPESLYSQSQRMPEIRAGDALATTFSALYGKLLVVMGIAFPMAEVISTYIPPSFYEVFYLYLYIGSMLFLFFMYATLIWGKPKVPKMTKSPKPAYRPKTASSTDLESINESDTDSPNSSEYRARAPMRRPSILAAMAAGGRGHYGSFYLRMGAVAFGIGSMIYSGLEFGQYFELERDTKCHNVLLALTPATRMAFIFIQMYFIFLNNEQMKVYRHKIIARFGLMHMIGTNLSVWLNVLIQETKHEILTFYNPENRTLRISHRLGNKIAQHNIETETAHLRIARGLKGPHHIFECRRTNIIGTLVQDASPFLFPCTIEYSLICAAILYVMWRGICRPQPLHPPAASALRLDSPGSHSPCKRSPHHYSVDCARAHKGLFIGILILVLTIISLILFFVLISRPEFVTLAVTEVTICELMIYATATIATLIGMVQVRHMQYDAYRNFQLDDILLVGAQTGLFLYSTFTVIGGHFTLRKDTVLVLITALASIVQTACQTMFILDASRRNAATPEHIRRKPGREIVTFLLVANLAMWAISTLEKSRAESHPIQLNFYGLWAWTIITHVSMPLAIFYRFHSTVCLCEIWKRAYKMKPSYC